MQKISCRLDREAEYEGFTGVATPTWCSRVRLRREFGRVSLGELSGGPLSIKGTAQNRSSVWRLKGACMRRIKLKPIEELVIVITGASSGIGLATALLGAKRGAKVVMGARSKDVTAEI